MGNPREVKKRRLAETQHQAVEFSTEEARGLLDLGPKHWCIVLNILLVLNRQNPAVVDMIHTRFTRYIIVVLDLPSGGFGGMNCPFDRPMI